MGRRGLGFSWGFRCRLLVGCGCELGFFLFGPLCRGGFAMMVAVVVVVVVVVVMSFRDSIVYLQGAGWVEAQVVTSFCGEASSALLYLATTTLKPHFRRTSTTLPLNLL